MGSSLTPLNEPITTIIFLLDYLRIKKKKKYFGTPPSNVSSGGIAGAKFGSGSTL